MGSEGFNSLPAKVSHNPEASLAWGATHLVKRRQQIPKPRYRVAKRDWRLLWSLPNFQSWFFALSRTSNTDKALPTANGVTALIASHWREQAHNPVQDMPMHSLQAETAARAVRVESVRGANTGLRRLLSRSVYAHRAPVAGSER